MKALHTVTIGDFIRSSSIRYPEKIAVVDGDRNIRYTYKELNMHINSLANGLIKAGVRKGDFVTVLLYNCIEFVETYFALAKIGAVAAPQVYRLSAGEIKELANLCEPKAFIFGQEFKDVLEKIRPDLPTVSSFVCVGENCPSFAISYEKLVTGYPSSEPEIEVYEEDPQYLNYTSGTTGLPKAYILTHYNNAVALPFQFDGFGVTSEDNILVVFPMYGRVGFAWTVMSVLKGATLITLNFKPHSFLETVQREKVTIVNLVPTMAQMILHYPDTNKYDLSSLRGIVFAGSPLPLSVYENTQKRICPNIYEYYGLQETAIITQISPEMKRKKPSSVGVPVTGVDVRLVDEEGKEVDIQEIGEIVMRGPGATTGYFKDPEKTALVVRNGWFHTGDLGRFDEDGYLYVVGRKKDMIVSGGQNVFAPEIEEIILTHPLIDDCAVIGIPHEIWGEAVCAVVVLKKGVTLTEEELIAFCKERMAHFKAPKVVKFRDNIPRNPAGKVKKFVLVEEYTNK